MAGRVDLSSVRMLIAEPERSMALLLSTIVRSVGVQSLVTAESPNQAVEQMRAGSINCALINETMGGMTAAQIIKPIRSILRPSQFSAIMMCTRPTPSAVRSATRAGYDLVLAKPFSAFDLYARASVLVNVTQARHREHEQKMERLEALSEYYQFEIDETRAKGDQGPVADQPVV